MLYGTPMRALWLESGTLRTRTEAARPEPAPGEALVRVRLAGVCQTDLELVRGYYSFTGIPGHEFVGVVEAAAGATAWVGRRVCGEINAVCGACAECQDGRPSHCARRTVLGIRNRHGAFAEYLTLPMANLHAVPDTVPDEAAVFTEPLAAALRVQEQADVGPGRRVLVVGAGRLGQLLARTLARTGCELRVVARQDRARRLLGDVGVTAIGPGEVPERWADVVVECTGDPEGLARGRRAVRPRGTIVLKSTYRGQATLDLSPLVVDEVSLVGSRCGPFAPALRLLAGGLDPAPLVDARYRLEEGVAAFAHAERPGALKVLISP